MAGKRRYGDGAEWFDEEKQLYRAALVVTVDGKRQRRTVSAKTLAELRFGKDKLRAKYRSGNLPAADGTVAELLLDYMAKSQLESSTLLRYRTLMNHVQGDGALWQMRLADLRTTMIGEFNNRLAKSGKSTDTVRKVYLFLQGAFENAITHGRLQTNPCAIPKSEKPRHINEEIHPMDRDRHASFLRGIAGDELEVLCMFTLDTWARQGEVFALEWKDLDLNPRAPRVCTRRTLKDERVWDEGKGKHVVRTTVGATKGKRMRDFPISRTTVALLAALQRSQPAGSALVFPNTDGGYRNRHNFNSRDWPRLISRVESYTGESYGVHTFHDLRHTGATLALEDGKPWAQVSAKLGHSKVSTTFDYYAHRLRSGEALLADHFDALLTAARQLPDQASTPTIANRLHTKLHT